MDPPFVPSFLGDSHSEPALQEKQGSSQTFNNIVLWTKQVRILVLPNPEVEDLRGCHRMSSYVR